MRDPYEPFQDELAATTPVPQLTPTDTELRQRAIDNCAMCDPDGYQGTTVCDHQPDRRVTALRGMARLRETMGWTPTSPRQDPEKTPGEH